MCFCSWPWPSSCWLSWHHQFLNFFRTIGIALAYIVFICSFISSFICTGKTEQFTIYNLQYTNTPTSVSVLTWFHVFFLAKLLVQLQEVCAAFWHLIVLLAVNLLLNCSVQLFRVFLLLFHLTYLKDFIFGFFVLAYNEQISRLHELFFYCLVKESNSSHFCFSSQQNTAQQKLVLSKCLWK